ncbi:MAG: hypothetical protein R3B49_10775 [Phycisphaerales bacterium]
MAIDAETYLWRLNGTPINDGPLYSGTQTDTLTVAPALDSEGLYDVVLTNFTGSTTSAPLGSPWSTRARRTSTGTDSHRTSTT